MTDKSAAENMLDAAKAKLSEGVDRAKAAGHDIAANMSNNPLDTAKNKVEGTMDRAKAEVHNAQANGNFNEGKSEATDGDGH